jgi:RimJ/RimL family protein N-acetyltransferase
VISSAETIDTERLVLTPLSVADAEEMVSVLDDVRLHEFIGGRPATLDELRNRYGAMVAGPGRADEAWLNWIVRERVDGTAVGTVQATVTATSAAVAWIVGVPWQGRGYAAEAATALVDWLRARGAVGVQAHVHPDHRASAAVARRAGMHPTGDEIDGETVWRVET